MPTRCCPECFDDQGLRKHIFPTLNPTHGNCGYCGSEDVDLILPEQLSTYFEMIANVYEPKADGKLLVEWMKEDWNLFTHPKMDVAHAKELLAEIFNDGEIVRQPFQPSSEYTSTTLFQWETLREELMYVNRWFLNSSFDTDQLKQFLYLLADSLPQRWYRARLHSGDESYSISNMGAPPKRRASNGRANPAGIPYLYLGSTPETAASELRPHTGETASVADFTIPDTLKAVDLRNPRKLVSPFRLGETSTIGQLRAVIPLLERLGEELTRPVLPSGSAIDYIPSQYLCEFIKSCGFDGVVYRSSVSDGYNLALFDPIKAVGGSVSLFSIKRVQVDVSPA